MTALLSPVLTAEPRALAELLQEDGISPMPDESRRMQIIALLKAVLPDAVQTPARMRRLNDALGEWLKAAPRSWREVEDARQEFQEIFEAHNSNVTRILDAASTLRFPAASLRDLEVARDEMQRLWKLIFDRWRSFTRAEYDAAMGDVRSGKVCDLDEVIRELQGRAH